MTPERLAALALFMAPVYAANLAPPFVRFWRGWNPPLHRRVFGTHKTVLGVVAGLAAAFVAAWACSFPELAERLAATRSWWLHGLLAGCGALGGDALKSLVKRRCGIAPGGRWVPFDQLDFQVGALLLAGPGSGLRPLEALFLLAAGFLGVLAVNRLAFRMRVKETKW